MTVDTEVSAPPAHVSARLVRSSLRYLRERLGAAALTALARERPGYVFLGEPARPAAAPDGWVALDHWLDVLALLEARWGDAATLRLLREMTRATMAAAVSTVWGTFLADTTPAELLERAGTFWSLSFDRGQLEVRERGQHRARLALLGWEAPPREVGAMVAEACNVFLARVGAHEARVLEERVSGRLEIVATW